MVECIGNKTSMTPNETTPALLQKEQPLIRMPVNKAYGKSQPQREAQTAHSSLTSKQKQSNRDQQIGRERMKNQNPSTLASRVHSGDNTLDQVRAKMKIQLLQKQA